MNDVGDGYWIPGSTTPGAGDTDPLDDSIQQAREAFVGRFAMVDGHADVWRAFDDGAVFGRIVEALAAPWRSAGVTRVCGVESRGFILGAAVALRLGLGFTAIRKGGGLFPGTKRSRATGPDYRGVRHVLRIQERSLRAGEHCLLVDDWIERGAQAAAACELVASLDASVIGISVIVDQLDDAMRGSLPRLTSILLAKELS